MAWFKVLLLAALGHVEAQQLVDMHTIVGIECGQLQLEAGWADWVQELAGLQEGSCDSLGFSEAAGFKEVDIPVVGKFSLGIFRKPDILGVAMQLGEQLGGQPAKQGDACCQVCKEDEDKLVRVASGVCQETCLTVGKKLIVSMAGLLEPGFQRGSSCASQGFPVLNATLMKGLEPAGFSWDVYAPQPPHTQTFRKVAAGICGEVTVDDQTQLATLQKIGLLEPGRCSSEGFSHPMGKQQIPGLENTELALFQKAGELDIVDAVHMLFAAITQDTIVLYKVVGDVCSEASVDRKFVQPLVALAFTEGSCQDHGYDQPSGSQSFTVLLTDLQLALYRKAGSLGIHI